MHQNTPEQIAALKNLQMTKDIGRSILKAEVSPCVFMYQGYPLQLTIELDSGGHVSISDNATGITAANATESDVVNLIDKVKLCECKRCKAPAFDPTSVETNRDGLCEKCFMSDLRADLDKAMKKDQAKLARLIAKYKKQGFTHHVVAWVHPAQGDDYQIDIFMKSPNGVDPEEVKEYLKMKRSTVLDDFKVNAI